jgi:protease PrsW
MAPEQIINNPVLFAIATGLIPTLLWLFFWLRIDRKRGEPFVLLFICFVVGAASVLFATLIQSGVRELMPDTTARVVVFAGIEELLKFFVFYMVAFKSPFDDEAIDPAIYMITVALGFAALENVFYVLAPGANQTVTAGLLTGGFRFFGSTLLHTIASGFVGICIGLFARSTQNIGMTLGVIGAIFLHSTFNFFILKNDSASFLQVYGYLWVAAIINLVILEKLRRLPLRNMAAQPSLL